VRGALPGPPTRIRRGVAAMNPAFVGLVPISLLASLTDASLSSSVRLTHISHSSPMQSERFQIEAHSHRDRPPGQKAPPERGSHLGIRRSPPEAGHFASLRRRAVWCRTRSMLFHILPSRRTVPSDPQGSIWPSYLKHSRSLCTPVPKTRSWTVGGRGGAGTLPPNPDSRAAPALARRNTLGKF
jgi:hypothetical protein